MTVLGAMVSIKQHLTYSEVVKVLQVSRAKHIYALGKGCEWDKWVPHNLCGHNKKVI